MKKIIVILAILFIISAGFCGYFKKKAGEISLENQKISAEIAGKQKEAEDLKKTNDSLKEEYERLLMEKADSFKEYENWERHNSQLEELLK